MTLICECVSGEIVLHSPRSVDAPSNLVTSEVTARSFRVSWTHAAGQVEKYRVVYYATKGSKPEEVCVLCFLQEFVRLWWVDLFTR